MKNRKKGKNKIKKEEGKERRTDRKKEEQKERKKVGETNEALKLTKMSEK